MRAHFGKPAWPVIARNRRTRRMLRKTISATITLLIAASLIWAANDPWKSKPYQQWDDKDVRKIFNDSPWAKVVQIAGPSTNSTPSAMPSASSGNSMPQNRGMGGGSGGSQYPQPSVDQDQQPSTQSSTPYVVRWVSSRTIREAAVCSAELKGQIK